jgi:hypothetical protein
MICLDSSFSIIITANVLSSFVNLCVSFVHLCVTGFSNSTILLNTTLSVHIRQSVVNEFCICFVNLCAFFVHLCVTGFLTHRMPRNHSSGIDSPPLFINPHRYTSSLSADTSRSVCPSKMANAFCNDLSVEDRSPAHALPPCHDQPDRSIFRMDSQ